jgi:hypothetical protein
LHISCLHGRRCSCIKQKPRSRASKKYSGQTCTSVFGFWVFFFPAAPWGTAYVNKNKNPSNQNQILGPGICRSCHAGSEANAPVLSTQYAMHAIHHTPHRPYRPFLFLASSSSLCPLSRFSFLVPSASAFCLRLRRAVFPQNRGVRRGPQRPGGSDTSLKNSKSAIKLLQVVLASALTAKTRVFASKHAQRRIHRSKCPASTVAPVAGAGQCTGCIWATAGSLTMPLQEARRSPHGRRYVLHSCSRHAAGPWGLL